MRIKFNPRPRLFNFSVKSKVVHTKEVIDYSLNLHNVPQQWINSKGEGIKIAILDTGLPIHYDINIVSSINFTSDPIRDLIVGHSTHVSGLCSGQENDKGIIGVAPKAQLYIAKVLDDNGSGDDDSVSSGINWAIQQKVDIINMSLGASPEAEKYLPKIKKACQDAYKAGIFIVCAAGNENDKVSFPAMLDECVAVAAIDSKKQRAWFSNKGGELDFASAGVNVYSTFINNTFAVLSGTSMSTPIISGIAALVLSEHRNRTDVVNTPINGPKDLKAHLKKISLDLGKTGFDADFGDGMPIFNAPPPPPPPKKIVPPSKPKPKPKPKPIPPPKKKKK